MQQKEWNKNWRVGVPGVGGIKRNAGIWACTA